MLASSPLLDISKNECNQKHCINLTSSNKLDNREIVFKLFSVCQLSQKLRN
jgi:hypothetical protein